MQIIQQLIGFFLIIVPPLELFRGAALALCGAIASKCVESHELGKLLNLCLVFNKMSTYVSRTNI